MTENNIKLKRVKEYKATTYSDHKIPHCQIFLIKALK